MTMIDDGSLIEAFDALFEVYDVPAEEFVELVVTERDAEGRLLRVRKVTGHEPGRPDPAAAKAALERVVLAAANAGEYGLAAELAEFGGMTWELSREKFASEVNALIERARAGLDEGGTSG